MKRMLPAVRALRSRAARTNRTARLTRTVRASHTIPADTKPQRKPEPSVRTSLALISALTLTAILLPGLIVNKWHRHDPPVADHPYLQAGTLAPSAVMGGNAGNGGAANESDGGPPAAGSQEGAMQSAGPGSASSGNAGKAEARSAGRTGSAAAASGNPAPQAPGSSVPAASSNPAAAARADAKTTISELDKTQIRIYLTKEKRIEKVPLELYVRGVVAGEMPVTFELEALKAQAIAARTYIVRRLALHETSDMPVDNADVTDTTIHQVYVPVAALMKRWPAETRRTNLKKLNDAVRQTRGQIITYGGQPIQALFFSTSNGYTENSEDYWNHKVPYLRSVASPWDPEISPSYKETVTLSLSEFYRKLGASVAARPAIRVLETTAGHRIKEIAVGDERLSGREVREKLGLASSQFTWKIDRSSIHITTYGYGHGVGMSQWGADGMAREGSAASQILAHYYSGTRVEKALKLPAFKS
ncbi:stage II sporulation protein D [Paenibacillus beijingensis]|uniref:stage II sporulation protein D n=1 Tax=Paenibacillus beijingensis TaxID=1126833 RepID=UPI000698D601|nr:stage II sporulation protein D [Paenibacillus beijingensis]